MRLSVAPGQKFGRLTVLIPEGRTRRKKTGKTVTHRTALCKCSCGALTAPLISSLRSGNTKSCGCFARDRRVQTNTTHGQTCTAEYGCWQGMKDRCLNPKNPKFHYYGGKGVTFAPAWEDYAQFLADVGPRPSRKHSLDRWPNRDGNYEPGNVRWGTPRQQTENRNCNVFVLLDGEELCLKAAARKLNFPYSRAKSRRRAGWPPYRWFEPIAAVHLASDWNNLKAPTCSDGDTQEQEKRPAAQTP